jgi:hypothetical protein
MLSRFFIVTIFALALFTRFVGINWDNGYFSHPDENNMAVALSQLSDNNLNPHFFAYGQFPLYLGYFSLKIINIPNTFPNSIYILRFYSAIFSLLFLYFAYLLSKELFKKSLIFILLLIFSPGLIQIAHFGTTESLLNLVFIANLYYLLKIYNRPKFKYFVLSAIFSGVALGSKITAVFFIWPIILMGLYKRQFLSTTFFILFSFFILLLTSPYNFIDINDFLSSMKYETGVARGSIEIFYTRQFFNTVPYLFQFIHIFPYVLGLPIFIFSIFGLYLFIKKPNPKIILVLIPLLVYFLYFGQLFVKWTRFMSPIFFIFPLFSTLFISKFNQKIQIILIVISCVPGILFFSQYFYQNPRLTVANWLNSNIPQNSTILSESGNVTDLKLRPDINIVNFDFYSLDGDYNNKIKLDSILPTVDFVLVPSRRIFKNQNNPMFPYSRDYYQNIFSDKYKLIYQTKNSNENAEETFTVFDFPVIRLYEAK